MPMARPATAINNYLIGGGGNDLLTGLGDDRGVNPDTLAAEAYRMDYIFGDEVIVDNDLYWIGDDRHVAKGHGGIDMATTTVKKLGNPNGMAVVDGMIENWYGTGETRVLFNDGTLGHILGDHGAAGDNDVAVYRGNRADYLIEHVTMNGHDAVKITHINPTDDGNGGVLFDDGIDILVDVETARFADQDYDLSASPLSDIQWNAVEPSGDNLPNGGGFFGGGTAIAHLTSDAPLGTAVAYSPWSRQFDTLLCQLGTARSARPARG